MIKYFFRHARLTFCFVSACKTFIILQNSKIAGRYLSSVELISIVKDGVAKAASFIYDLFIIPSAQIIFLV